MRPSKLGDICCYRNGGKEPQYYLVTKVGKRGACSGPLIYPLQLATFGTCQRLRTRTFLVPPDKVPDHVCVALAKRALLGRS